MFAAIVLCFGAKTNKVKAPTNCGLVLGDTAEKAAGLAIPTLRSFEQSYPGNHYEVLVGELNLRATPPEPTVELTPVKASDY